MSKFLAGQTVRCIEPINPRPNGEDRGGGGWELGFKFRIGKVDNIGTDRVPILWPLGGGAGIYEDYVELIETEWDPKEN